LLERIQAERSVQTASKMPLGRKRKQLVWCYFYHTRKTTRCYVILKT
jgi:hypothetical protein